MDERVDLQEFLGGFIVEAEQLLASSTSGLLELEDANARGELRPKAVRDLFRALHTLKGLAGMMDVRPIVELAHALETIVRSADQAGGRMSPRGVELGVITVRALAERVRAVAERREPAPAPEALLADLARLDTPAASPAPPSLAQGWDRNLGLGERRQIASALAEGRHVYALAFAPSDDRAARGITIATVRTKLATIAEIVKVVPRSQPPDDSAPAGLRFDLLVITDAPVAQLAEIIASTPDQVVPITEQAEPLPAPSTPSSEEELSPIQRSFVRVELARLDELQEQLSALLTTRFRLERALVATAEHGRELRELREIADLIGRQLRDLRHGILRARLVRVAEVLEPLQLLARSLSRPGTKEMRLELELHGTELDKAVADRLLPAIVHLVRNAYDHALEPTAERRQLGKPPIGRVSIVCREGATNQLEIEVSDDGRGIDIAAIASRTGRAIDSSAALLDVLSAPGFSTRTVATETSGRGMGMNIVRRTVASLGGELAVDTELGQGSRFTMRVPLTIAIIDVLSFECGRERFVAPAATIEELFDLADHPMVVGPSQGRAVTAQLCERRGRALPVVGLGDVLDVDGTRTPTKALVVRRGGELLAFAVDRMLGRHEVVVRPIEDRLARVRGIAGATDLGDGRPTLLLDLLELGAAIHEQREASA